MYLVNGNDLYILFEQYNSCKMEPCCNFILLKSVFLNYHMYYWKLKVCVCVCAKQKVHWKHDKEDLKK